MSTEKTIEPVKPPSVALRVLLGIPLAGLLAWLALDIPLTALFPGSSGLKATSEFFSAAFTPAFHYEAAFVPETAKPFLLKVIDAMRMTLWFAAGGIGIALSIGCVFGLLCSNALWVGELPRGAAPTWVRVLGALRPIVYGLSRTLMTICRSIHELLWAVLFLSAFGVNEFSAVLAIGLPSGGVLAKVFSELIDEAPRGALRSLEAVGASKLSAFVVGVLPLAAPDIVSYALYRFECAIRASAVLGFFGFPTLGYYLSASFENLHYKEVWTFLYAIFVLIILADIWSSAIRRRLVG